LSEKKASWQTETSKTPVLRSLARGFLDVKTSVYTCHTDLRRSVTCQCEHAKQQLEHKELRFPNYITDADTKRTEDTGLQVNQFASFNSFR